MRAIAAGYLEGGVPCLSPAVPASPTTVQPTATSLWRQARRHRTSAACRCAAAARAAGAWPCGRQSARCACASPPHEQPLQGGSSRATELQERSCRCCLAPHAHLPAPCLQIETYLKASQFRQKVQAAKERLGQAAAGNGDGPKVRDTSGWVGGVGGSVRGSSQLRVVKQRCQAGKVPALQASESLRTAPPPASPRPPDPQHGG